MLIVNFKTYPQALGPKALELSQTLLKIAQNYPRIPLGLAPAPMDLGEVAAHLPAQAGTRAQIWAQHIDKEGAGQKTGYLSASSARAAGAHGTFLNHSEHPLEPEALKETVRAAKEAGLKVLLFARDPRAVAEFAALRPDFIAYEPPELIGGKISVSQAKPEVIREAVSAAGEIPLLVGAGIHAREDIKVALARGARGAAVSSAVVASPSPAEVLEELLKGF